MGDASSSDALITSSSSSSNDGNNNFGNNDNVGDNNNSGTETVPAIKLIDRVIKSFGVARIFHANSDRINRLDFSDDGNYIITSGDDDQIDIYNCLTAESKRTIFSRKYGVDLVKFTHTSNCVLHASTKTDDTIRYLSVHDNRYLRYFNGHTKRVASISMSPTDDTFISTAEDNQLRLWDLRSPGCQGLMTLDGKPVAGIDPEGLIFGVGYEGRITLHDLRAFSEGPFLTFNLDWPEATWTSLKFSPDGRSILVGNSRSAMKIIHSFSGKLLRSFVPPQHPFPDTNPLSKPGQVEGAFTPDSKYLLAGSSGGTINIWKVSDGSKVATLRTEHPRPVEFVQFNPKYMLMASAGTSLCLWLPTVFE